MTLMLTTILYLRFLSSLEVQWQIRLMRDNILYTPDLLRTTNDPFHKYYLDCSLFTLMFLFSNLFLSFRRMSRFLGCFRFV